MNQSDYGPTGELLSERGVRPRAWMVQGHLLDCGVEEPAIWLREPTDHDRKVWGACGLNVAVSALVSADDVCAEVMRLTLQAESCEGDGPEVDSARKALATSIIAAVRGHLAPAPVGTQHDLFAA